MCFAASLWYAGMLASRRKTKSTRPPCVGEVAKVVKTFDTEQTPKLLTSLATARSSSHQITSFTAVMSHLSTTSFLRPLILTLSLAVCCASPSTAKLPDSDFAPVYSLLQKACFECHGPEKQEGDLRLDRPADLANSFTVVAGEPEDSELLRRITLPQGHDEIMPAIGDPLSTNEIAIIRNWIIAGAEWPEDFAVTKHWSYVAPVLPEIPQLENTDWARNEIDHFVAAKLAAEKIAPSSAASPETLIRRVHFDLIGLPPTPAEVGAFTADPSDEAYQQIITDLLNRPQFGERWARPWLDLARYADSHGFQRDNLRDIWAYRDWVIRALNADMPFDRFTIEQIAGDLLPNATEAQKIATGFHRCTPTNVEAGSLPEETRIEQVIDRVNTTGAVWLGTTLECCQCHDHKYDPFSAKDYYGILAFFNSTEAEADRTDPKKPSSIAFKGPQMVVANAEKSAQRAELEARQAELKSQQQARRKQLSADLNKWAAELAASLKDAPQVHTLPVVGFESLGEDDPHQLLDDGSVLLAGKQPPSLDTYRVTVRMNLQNVTAFRLDALTHDSLPGTGPGRGDSKKTNFVLNRFSAATSNGDGLKFTTATADFAQKNWPPTGALSDKARTGWAIAPEFKKPHWAQFVLAQPLNCTGPEEFTFELKHDYGQARSIGRLKISAVTGNVSANTMPAEIAAIIAKQADELTKAQRKILLDYRAKNDPETITATAKSDKLAKQITDLADDTTLVMIEMPKPRKSYVFVRGDYRSEGEPVTPAAPAVLHPMADGPSNRLTLAKWLIDPANPLVARVTVNRWWAEIFGEGIVSTVEDFGIKGDAPSHPELLDWLAVEFVDSGWSMKHMLRTIVTSSTYRQSSVVTPDLLEADPSNRMLSRGPGFRMDAETIRDNALAVSGLLNLKQFGPPIRPYQPDGIWSKVGGTSYKYETSPGTEQHRRGIYVVLKRGAPYPSFMNFDASARLACTVKRSRTNTPLQALTLLNDPVYVEAAKALVQRVFAEAPSSETTDRLTFAFRLCTARTPSAEELGTLADLLETQHSVARTNGESSQAIAKGVKLPDEMDAAEFSAWYSVASALINLHETITKN